MVEIHLERGTVMEEYGPYSARFGAFQRPHYRRGPIRLVVTASSPAYDRYHMRFMIALSLVPAVFLLALIPVAGALFCVLVSVLVVATFAVTAWDMTGPERLEVDSRIVTVTRREQVRMWGREQLVGLQLNPLSAVVSGKTSRAARLAPTIVWDPQGQGRGMAYAGAMGSGLSKAEAEQVIEALNEFCDEYPRDPHYSFKSDGLPWQ